MNIKMQFKEKLQTKNYSKTAISLWSKPVIIKPKYIMYHHTATSNLEVALNILLGKTNREVSAHFLIAENGDIYKLSEPEYRCWHAGEGLYNGIKDMNSYSIGIEVMGPYSHGFYDRQKTALKELTKYLMGIYGIKVENVIRHKDYTGRKIDIDDRLWNNEFKSFNEWKMNKLS